MGDTESCSSRAVDCMPRNQRLKLDVFNEVVCRLIESNNEEASLLGFEDELWDHFCRLPPRYAMDVNVERAEDVIMHKRLLQMAHNPATRPAIEVRLVQVPRQSDGHSGDSVDSELQLQYFDYLGKHSIHPPPAFGSLSDSELLHKYQDKDITVIARPLCFRLVHEITISTIDKPKLLSQLTSLLSEIGLNIQEARAFSTIDGYALDVFVVDNWVPEDTERLRSMLFKEIPKIEDTERLRSMVFKQQPEHLEKEKQALPHHGSECHISQFSGSFGQDEEVIVNVDNIADVSDKETTIASKSCSGSPSRKATGSAKKFKVSFEDVIHEAVRERSKDSHQPSFSALEQNSWRFVVNKAKSRLIDQPEEHYQRTERTANSDGALGEEDDDEDVPEEYRNIKHNTLIMMQWVSLALIIAALVCSLSIPVLKRQTLWDLPLWKWEIMVLALISGRLVSGWGIKLVVIFIESNFLLRKRVLYFVYGLRRAVQNCLWLGLVLFIWHLTFDDRVEKSKSKILLYGTKILVCFFIGTLIWLLKTLLVKVLASSFHVNAFFERIQEALYNQYVIESLSGSPFPEWRSTKEEVGAVTGVQQIQNSGSTSPGPGDLKETLLAKEGRGKLKRCATVGKKPRFSNTTPHKKDEEIPIDKMQKLNHMNISAWNMTGMINIIRHGALSTLDEHILDSDIKDDYLLHIRSECQAKEAAKKIFQKVAKTGSHSQIYLDDMTRFMNKEAALKAMHLMGITREDEGISKSSLKSWLVNAFRERRALALSLNDTKTAVDELHNMLSILVGVIIMIIWLIILGIPISHFLVFISSQLLLVVFIFGNTCKTVFEAIIFLFIMHPFDVGDRCEIDGIQLRVEEMNILTTVFLRSDNQKIVYPNSVLASKPIGNFYRSPDMTEAIDFSVHISTPMEKISNLKYKIKGYVEGNSNHWHQNSMVFVTDVEDMNKMKMSLWVTHRMNHQEMQERWARRNLLLEEMIKVFKELDIEYRMLPLDVNIRNMPPLISNRLPSNWTTCAN